MFNYTKSQLAEKANEMNFVRDTLEKVMRLAEILNYLNSNPLTKEYLVLKGGTAINLTVFKLPRLSVDIDLDFSKNVSREEMLAIRERLREDIKIYMSTQGYAISPRSKAYHSLDSFVFTYINLGGVQDNIKVEINYSLRAHLFEPVDCSIEILPEWKDKIGKPSQSEPVINSTRLFDWIFKQVQTEVFEGVLKGTYNQMVKDELPLEYRYGYISRKAFWDRYPKEKANALRDLTSVEIDNFCKTAKEKGGRPIKDLTFNRYFEIVADAYKSIGLAVEGKTPYELFKAHADDRDGKICKAFDFDSPYDFMAFDRECYPTQTWEWKILTRKNGLQIVPLYDADGYRFVIRASAVEYPYEIVKIHQELTRKGIAVQVDFVDALIRYLREEDNVGFVPITERASHYPYPLQHHNVIEYRFIQEVDEEFVKGISWMPIKELELAPNPDEEDGDDEPIDTSEMS